MEWLSDIFTMQFAAALASIIVIDLVLAGDNAILIALAARNAVLEAMPQVMNVMTHIDPVFTRIDPLPAADALNA